MVTMSAANTTAVKGFDVDSFVLGFRTPEYRVSLFRRADLIPQINELEGKLDTLEAATADKAARKTYSDKGAAGKADSELDDLTREYNALVEEFEASKVEFQFRPFTGGELKQWVARTKDLAEDDETDVPMWAEGLALTCVSHPLTVQDWLKLCDAVGTFAFLQFGRTWNTALSTGGAPDAPFSHRSSPSQSTGKRSAG